MSPVVVIPPPSIYGSTYNGPVWLGWVLAVSLGLCALAVLAIAIYELIHEIRR